MARGDPLAELCQEEEGEIAPGLSFSILPPSWVSVLAYAPMLSSIEGKRYAIDGKPPLLWMRTGGMYRVELSLVLQHCCLGRPKGAELQETGINIIVVANIVVL